MLEDAVVVGECGDVAMGLHCVYCAGAVQVVSAYDGCFFSFISTVIRSLRSAGNRMHNSDFVSVSFCICLSFCFGFIVLFRF